MLNVECRWLLNPIEQRLISRFRLKPSLLPLSSAKFPRFCPLHSGNIYMHLPSCNIGNEIAKGRRCLRLLDIPRFYARRGLLSSAAISLSLVLQCKKNVLPESTELLLLLLESCRQKPDNLVLLRAHLSTLLCIRYTLEDDLPSRKQKQLMRTSM